MQKTDKRINKSTWNSIASKDGFVRPIITQRFNITERQTANHKKDHDHQQVKVTAKKKKK